MPKEIAQARAAAWLLMSILLAGVPADGGPRRAGSDARSATVQRANRLSGESSPYLRLHADNPVDWYPWGAEAFERARREDKPIFLSVGYSTCYWCHVMERRVFADAAIAELMNRWFVSIKVDREERPDIDEIYMTSTTLLTGQGGWPNSVFLTPAAEPFFAGTYFPPQDEDGRPGFPTVLRAVHEAWRERRAAVEQLAARHAERLRVLLGAAGRPVGYELPLAAAASAVQALQATYDSEFGGFGRAPKFPSCASLSLLWNRAEQGDEAARRMVLQTLRAMGRGAIYDQLGGGFHRYALDRAWRLPHFEKMLYDNAQLLELLARVAAATGDAEIDRLARGTADFLLAELRLPGGAFQSAIDAATDGEEGAFYVWSRQELEAVLGGEDFRFAAPILGFDGEPNFGDGRHTLFLTDALERHADLLGPTPARFWSRWAALRSRLEARRRTRPRPRIDDKVLTDWNGLAIAALASAGRTLAEDRYLRAAVQAAEFVSTLRDEEGRLLHVWRNGEAKILAFLDDYAFLAHGLLALAEATGQRRWLRQAEELTQEMERHLREPRGGYFGGPANPLLLVRSRPAADGAVPAGNGVAALNLLRLAERTGRPIYRWRAEAVIRAFAAELEQAPAALPTLALAALVAGETAVVAGDRAGSRETLRVSAEEIVDARLRLAEPSDEGWRRFALELRVRDGWHLNANPASSEFLVPTTVAGEVRRLNYPPARSLRFEFAAEELRVYHGALTIVGELAAGASGVRLTYQACDDRRCLPPVTRVVALAGSAARRAPAQVP